MEGLNLPVDISIPRGRQPITATILGSWALKATWHWYLVLPVMVLLFSMYYLHPAAIRERRTMASLNTPTVYDPLQLLHNLMNYDIPASPPSINTPPIGRLALENAPPMTSPSYKSHTESRAFHAEMTGAELRYDAPSALSQPDESSRQTHPPVTHSLGTQIPLKPRTFMDEMTKAWSYLVNVIWGVCLVGVVSWLYTFILSVLAGHFAQNLFTSMGLCRSLRGPLLVYSEEHLLLDLFI